MTERTLAIDGVEVPQFLYGTAWKEDQTQHLVELALESYWRLLPTLVSQYRDQYVAIHEGQVVASGTNQVELALRVYRQFGYVPIYVGLVSDEPWRMFRLPSPRVLGEARKV